MFASPKDHFRANIVSAAGTVGVLALTGIVAFGGSKAGQSSQDIRNEALVASANDASSTAAALNETLSDARRSTEARIRENQPERIAHQLATAQELHGKLGQELAKWEAALAEYQSPSNPEK